MSTSLKVSIIETVGLVVWLALAMAGSPLLGAGVLFGTLVLEHFVAYKAANPNRLFPPKLKLVIASLAETVIWVGWLMIAAFNPLLALLVLFVALYVQHNAEVNILTNRPTFSKLLSTRVAGFTAYEAIGGAIWLQLALNTNPILAVVVLFGFMLLEHRRQGQVVEESR